MWKEGDLTAWRSCSRWLKGLVTCTLCDLPDGEKQCAAHWAHSGWINDCIDKNALEKLVGNAEMEAAMKYAIHLKCYTFAIHLNFQTAYILPQHNRLGRFWRYESVVLPQLKTQIFYNWPGWIARSQCPSQQCTGGKGSLVSFLNLRFMALHVRVFLVCGFKMMNRQRRFSRPWNSLVGKSIIDKNRWFNLKVVKSSSKKAKFQICTKFYYQPGHHLFL